MIKDSVAQLEQARAELAELGNPYAHPRHDWVDDHLRHLAIQRYHALREMIASHGNWLPDERQVRCPRCGGSGEVA